MITGDLLVIMVLRILEQINENFINNDLAIFIFRIINDHMIDSNHSQIELQVNFVQFQS